jgi:hypothetical protein
MYLLSLLLVSSWCRSRRPARPVAFAPFAQTCTAATLRTSIFTAKNTPVHTLTERNTTHINAAHASIFASSSPVIVY